MLKKNKVKIGIVGAGGIGGLIAILLSSKKIDVHCSRGNKTADKIQLKLKSNYFGHKTKILKFTNKIFKNFDVIFISVKYQKLGSALKKIDGNSNKVIIPLLNGIRHIDLLKRKFKNKCIIANIGKTVSFKDKKNFIIHKSYNKPVITLSSENKSLLKNIIKIKKILKNANIKTIIKKNDDLVIWTKLIRINALSSITALYNNNLGEIRSSNEKKKYLIKMLKETLLLTHKKKLMIDFKNLIKEINSFPDNLTTSMQRDISEGKKSEIETILGGVLREAKKENIVLKTNEKVYKLLKKKINGKKNFRNSWR